MYSNIFNILPFNYFLNFILQIANIGPISYSLARLLIPSLKPGFFVYILLCIGCISSLLLAIFWNYTSYIDGTEHSIALLVLVFLLSLVDCTSSVLFLPYMVVWRSIYLPSYLVGEGLSGLVPALVALGQGVGGDQKCINITIGNDTFVGQEELQPNFSVTTFFHFLFCMMTVSAIAYTLLENLTYIQSEKVSDPSLSASSPGSSTKLVTNTEEIRTTPMKKHSFFAMLIVQAFASMLTNGVLPSIQSYSCGPYGNETYHLAATLSAVANPFAAFMTLILPRAKPKMLHILNFVGTIVACYIFATAVLSPEPPLVDDIWGSVIVVSDFILLYNF